MKIFSERLREVLMAKQISQAELARRINISQSTVNGYCTGKTKPSLNALFLICKELNTLANYLLGIID